MLLPITPQRTERIPWIRTGSSFSTRRCATASRRSRPACRSSRKSAIARQLAQLKVDVIEAGFPISSPGDFESVETIAREVEGPVDLRAGPPGREGHPALRQGGQAGASGPRIHTFVGDLGHPPREEAAQVRGRVLEMVRRASSSRGSCAATSNSRPRTPAARSATSLPGRRGRHRRRAPARSTSPTPWATPTPEHFGRHHRRRSSTACPNIDKAIISVHCHNDLGMATANSLTAVAHGARQVECTINGLGERAGNAALEEVVMALRCGRTCSPACRSASTRSEIMRDEPAGPRRSAACPCSRNKAIVGANAFAHSSGHPSGRHAQRAPRPTRS